MAKKSGTKWWILLGILIIALLLFGSVSAIEGFGVKSIQGSTFTTTTNTIPTVNKNTATCDGVMTWINNNYNNKTTYCGTKSCNLCADSTGKMTNAKFYMENGSCKWAPNQNTCQTSSAYEWCKIKSSTDLNPIDQTGGFTACPI